MGKKIKKWCFTPLRNILCCIAILIAAAIILLHIPSVQQHLLCKTVNHLNQTTDYHLKCNTIRLTWLNHIALESIEVLDPQRKHLFTVKKCKCKFNLLSLLPWKPAIIESLSIADATLELEENNAQVLNIEKFYTNVILPFLPKTTTNLLVKKATLSNSNFSYHNLTKQQNINIEKIDIGIQSFLYSTDNYAGKISYCSYKETKEIPFILKNLTTKFQITPYSITLKSCQLTTKQSNLQGDFRLQHIKQLSLFSGKENLALEAKCNNTMLSSIELNRFSNFFTGIDMRYKLNGVIYLTAHSIAWKNCQLTFGLLDNYIETTGSYNTITKKTDISVKRGMLHTTDLHPYLKKMVRIDPYLRKLKYIALTKATFMGNTENAQLTGHVTTNIGTIKLDLTISNFNKNETDFSYNGTIALDQIAIHAILPFLPITSLSATITVQGKGSNMKDGTVDITASIREIQTATYNYKTISASSTISNGMMRFKIDSKDPNVAFTIAGNYDISSKNSIKADGIVKKIQLKSLGYTETPLAVSTQFSFTLYNILENFPQGSILFREFIIQGAEKKIACKRIAVHSIEQEGANLLTLTSPLMDCKLKGTFTIHDLSIHIKHLIAKLNNPLSQASISGRLRIDYTINCKNILPILNWFSNDLYISPTTICLGHFTYDEAYHFSLDLPKAATICLKQLRLEYTKINLIVNHLTNPKKRLIQLHISSEKQKWYKKFVTDQLLCKLRIDKNTFTISNSLSALKNHTTLSVTCKGTLLDNAIQIDLLPSTLKSKDKIWTIQTAYNSTISQTAIEIGELSISNGKEEIIISGKLNKTEKTLPLHCTIRNLALDYYSEVIEGNVQGIMDAKLVAYLQQGDIITTSELTIKECSIKDYAIGTFTTKVNGSLLENKYTLEGMLQKTDQQLLKISGCYYPQKQQNSLHITATFNKMELQLLNPFVATVFSEIQGKLSGQFLFTGSFSEPKLTGTGTIDKGKFKINYLNTLYQVKGRIQAKENIIYMDNLDIHDNQTGHATLSGNIALQNGFPLLLSGKVKKLHLLDTNQTHNPDFYGMLHGSGTLQIKGPLDNLIFTIKATASSGTFTILSDNKENFENTTNLVRFIYNKNNKQSEKEAIATENHARSDIKLILDLTILPAVKTMVLFGPHHNHNVVKGRGNGKIQLEIGTNRKPYIMGNYIFQKGSCTVSVYNLMEKTFTIAENSKLTFNGYPQDGIAHINASHTQMVSIAEFDTKNNDTQSIPATISLTLSGSLTNPAITYGFSFPGKNIDTKVYTELERCRSKALLDKNYLNKQILSLLVAKRVYNEKEINGWDALSNTINDLLSQQIQNWTSKIAHNLAIETDLGINQWRNKKTKLFQRPKIKVSYLLLAKQLKFSSRLGRGSNLLNDWEISYQMSKYHNMHAKLYQQPLENDYLKTSFFGISLCYMKKFY